MSLWKPDRREPPASDPQARARDAMVAEQIAARGVRDPRVLEALRKVPRHLFVPPAQAHLAYEDMPLPIGHDQTISQPYIVGLMTELTQPRDTDRALELGTGCGYQTAVLARLVAHVYTVEIVESLAHAAMERLRTLGVENLTMRAGDGYDGWPEAAPFDIILAAAAPEEVPPALVAQLAPGGRLVLPVGPFHDQSLMLIEKSREGGTLRTRSIVPVRFVPLIRR